MEGGFISRRSFDAWVLMQDTTNSIVTALDKDNKYLDKDYYDQSYASDPPVIAMGDTAIPFPFAKIDQSYCTTDDLNSGYKPSSIVLTNISLNSLSDEKLNEFLEYCGFGKPLASAKASQNTAPSQAAKAGILENENGEKYLWYALAFSYDNDGYNMCTIGCMKIDVAYTTLGISTSASASPSDPKGYWNDADNATKSKLVAKSILEHYTSDFPNVSIED